MAGSRYRDVVAGDELQFIVFRLASAQLAINIFQVARILRYTVPEALPDGPAGTLGGIAFGGTLVPVVDLRARLGLPAELREETRIMVLEFEAGRLAVVVDQVHEAMRVDTRTIGRVEGADPVIPADWIAGAIARPGRQVLVLHAARLPGATGATARKEARA
ncbi:MAG: purine-binding chemotaxis protein CheW [Gemmatimonadetes bacterium]|nr:purine-binding chemotaxis protein CheW [Gemmatimonadota bacterium]